MTTTADLLIDAFGRIREEMAALLDGLDDGHLLWRPDAASNSIGWLVWHLTRIQDDHLAKAFDQPQIWHSAGWETRFGLPYDPDAHGYGQTAEEVGQMSATVELLRGYFEAVADKTDQLLREVTDADLDRVVDTRWNPPVTLAVRLISVIGDDLQHVGQAAYVKGLAQRR